MSAAAQVLSGCGAACACPCAGKSAEAAELQAQEEEHPRELIPELCRQFYDLGYVSGTGGGIAIRQGEEIWIAPSGVQKERMRARDLFVFSPAGEQLRAPAPELSLKPSQCTPLFFNAFHLRRAGACIHTHSQHAVLATLLGAVDSPAGVGEPGVRLREWRITHQEMIKGVRRGNSGEYLRYFDELVVPIIENTPQERDLTSRMEAAIKAYPDACAVLVERHGIYVWGPSWQSAKTICECLDYLFELALKMARLGLDPAQVPEDSPYKAEMVPARRYWTGEPAQNPGHFPNYVPELPAQEE